MNNSCAEIALDIETYYAGRNQCTHPNVIAFDQPWHGYQFWMAYTAYPYANGFEENPCVAASNDLLHWEKPEGLCNPIACCEEVECDELKDTHLLYNADNDSLELWYLGRYHSTFAEKGPLLCYRRTSKDGILWSDYEIMFQFTRNLASPTVLYSSERKCYQFWGIRNAAEDIGLYYMESADGHTWSEQSRCMVPQDKETNMWHGAVTNVSGGVHSILCGLEHQMILPIKFIMQKAGMV